jgi:hypothetical protein
MNLRNWRVTTPRSRENCDLCSSAWTRATLPDADAARVQACWRKARAKHELEALEDAYPDWREITGAVDVTQQQPDPDNAFRKWLATKDEAYQRG